MTAPEAWVVPDDIPDAEPDLDILVNSEGVSIAFSERLKKFVIQDAEDKGPVDTWFDRLERGETVTLPSFSFRIRTPEDPS